MATDKHGHVLITGALGGLGTAIVRRLLKDGYEVIATDRREASDWHTQFSGAEQQRLSVLPVDITDENAVNELRDSLQAKNVHVAYLINNAGVAGAGIPWSMASKTFDIIMRVNLYGTFYCTRAFSEAMVREKFGRIVNFASLYAYTPGPGQAPYAAAKAGIVGYTHSTAKDLASSGINVNVIAPGLIWHERLEGVLSEEEYAQVRKDTPIGRAGEPEEIAGTVAFLLSPDSSYITGQTLHVNGGCYMTG